MQTEMEYQIYLLEFFRAFEWWQPRMGNVSPARWFEIYATYTFFLVQKIRIRFCDRLFRCVFHSVNYALAGYVLAIPHKHHPKRNIAKSQWTCILFCFFVCLVLVLLLLLLKQWHIEFSSLSWDISNFLCLLIVLHSLVRICYLNRLYW